ncbi:MAG: hypothetical protein HY675_27695 [Chloroflexi bacterium]|nr:hypothetical protein [Chloroflexota bacterium]
MTVFGIDFTSAPGPRKPITCAECTLYGIRVELPGSIASQAEADATGDVLDALLCAIQAAWAFAHRDRNYGIPPDCDPGEGCKISMDAYRGIYTLGNRLPLPTWRDRRSK